MIQTYIIVHLLKVRIVIAILSISIFLKLEKKTESNILLKPSSPLYGGYFFSLSFWWLLARFARLDIKSYILNFFND